jgi:NADPH-dependent glutamate synthase beta subunit-like oxidoreductase
MGYPVTIFEAISELGGMLRQGIPEYRLPRNILDAQINYIGGMGVEFKTGVTFGRDMTLEELKKDYRSVFLAIGNQLSSQLDLVGSKLEGVLTGLDFLREVNLKHGVKVPDRVVVIGGGNVAVDVALTALRLGAKDVRLVCLERKGEMPAYKQEIVQAEEEGVKIETSWGPQRIVGGGQRVEAVDLKKCLSVFDKSGNFNPSYDENERKTLETDMIILAVGQTPALPLLPKGVRISGRNTIQVDPVTLETNLSGIFAGGDIVSGAASVVSAIAAGRRASVSISRHLLGEDLTIGRDSQPGKVEKPPKEGIEVTPRQLNRQIDVNQRAGNFREVNMGFDQYSASLEIRRCMSCGSRSVITYPQSCVTCSLCETDCPQKAITVSLKMRENSLSLWGG